MSSEHTPLEDITDRTKNLWLLEKYQRKVSIKNNTTYQQLLFANKEVNKTT